MAQVARDVPASRLGPQVARGVRAFPLRLGALPGADRPAATNEGAWPQEVAPPRRSCDAMIEVSSQQAPSPAPSTDRSRPTTVFGKGARVPD
eukprot:85568-Pyramimonas_sp.AAC.1